MNKIKSYIFVAVQLVCIIYLAYSGKIIPADIILFIVFIALCIPAVWAILMMKNSINIFPDVRNNAKLLSRGIYKYIRHPMYFSVLSVCLLWLIDTYTFVRLIFWIVLLIDMILKMNFEEKKLSESFDDYKEYCSRTYRLIPYIY